MTAAPRTVPMTTLGRATGLLPARILAVVGLVVDAGVHLRLAPSQPPALDRHVSQSSLFYAETALALLAAGAIVVSRRVWASVFAAVVAGTALTAVLLSRYVDIGSIGPIPDLYEPAWYASKVLTTVAEAVALIASVALAVTATISPVRKHRQPPAMRA